MASRRKQLKEVKAALAALQEELLGAKEERKAAKNQLENAILEEKADSILAGLKSLYDGASANLTGLQREKEKLLEEKNILIRSYSSSDEETREISPVSDGSLKQEIDSTIEKTKKYLFRTERWGCVTIIKKRTAITFAHNEHRTLEVGNIIKIFSIEKDSQYDLKVRKVNIESGWVLLEADVDLCEKGPIWEPVVYGRRYVQLGLSAPHQEDSPFAISTGVIHSQRPNMFGHTLGSVGVNPGDSGGGCFNQSSGCLVGINVGCENVPISLEKDTGAQIYDKISSRYAARAHIIPIDSFQFV
ncbi:hypothetical protein MT418_000717 [Batrachochytrium dendrobatidis]